MNTKKPFNLEKLTKRFWDKVRKSDECWEWTGYIKKNNGYGQLGFFRRKLILAHRLSWIIHFGPIPDGLKVLHRCDNRPCVRPDHLFLGTCQDNSADMVAKGRSSHKARANGEKNPNAKLTAEDVIEIRKRYSSGESVASLSSRFGCTKCNIWRVAAGGGWKHLSHGFDEVQRSFAGRMA